MNAKDMIYIMEHFQTFKKPEKSRWKKPKEQKLDLPTLMRKQVEEAEATLKFVKDWEKLSKKEEKKEEKKGHSLTFAEGIILAYIAQFIIGPLYKVTMLHLGVQ